MPIYYQLKANQPKIDKRFESEIEVCDYIIKHKELGVFEVFRKDDIEIPLQVIGSAMIFPMKPMNEDVTNEILGKVRSYKDLMKK